MKHLLLIILVLTAAAAYSASVSEEGMVKSLQECWERSNRLMQESTPSLDGNSWGDPAYQQKQVNDARCYALQREIAKKHKREYACYYKHATQQYKCKHDIGGQ